MQISSVERLDDVIKDLRFLSKECRDFGESGWANRLDDIIKEIGSLVEED
jgi:hypothetical protein